jgi:DNA-binding NtrC family response regulator
MNVLVLDDTTELLRYFKCILKPIPKIHSIYTAINAKEFLEGLYERTQHVLICDIMMEPMNGPDILRKYKAAVGSTPIVLMSCSDDLHKIEQELMEERFNVVASFQKPVLPLDFLKFFDD